LTLASLEHGRLAGEGQEKFNDKGQFGRSWGEIGKGERQREQKQKRENVLKMRERELSPCFNMMKYPKTSVTDPA